MRSVVVNIGRNIGNTPMPAEVWEDFRTEVLRTALNLNGDIYAQGTIEGIWEGKTEEAFTVQFTIPDNVDAWVIERAFALLGVEYQQDAIAVLIGEPAFVGQATLV